MKLAAWAGEDRPHTRLVGGGASGTRQLVVRELSVEFGGLLALDRVSMSADYRETVGVIGPNGAGKTTLFNVICGFMRAGSGTITYDGVPLQSARPHDLNRRGMARTLQGVGLCKGMTVLENVMLGAQARLRCDIGSAFLGLWRSSREEHRVGATARELLERLDIAGYAAQLPAALPYGIQKRTALARALMAGHLAPPRRTGHRLSEPGNKCPGRPDQEPWPGNGRRHCRAPNQDLVTSVCDRIVVLNFGQVIADGTPDEIRSNSRSGDGLSGPRHRGANVRPGVAGARECLKYRT